MLTTLLTAYAAGDDGFSVVQVLTVIAVFALVSPLLARLRRTVSARRRARWAAQESTTAADDPSLDRND